MRFNAEKLTGLVDRPYGRRPERLSEAEQAVLVNHVLRGPDPDAEFAQTVPDHTHAAMVLDQAGWHDARALRVPESVTLVPLPAYSPELNPVERVWLYLRERYLSHRLLADYETGVEACCDAWNALTAKAGRLRSLTAYPYLKQVSA